MQVAQGAWHKTFDWSIAFPAFDFWRSSRMMPPNQENFDPVPLAFWVPDKIAGSPEIAFHITEFPFFTFLFRRSASPHDGDPLHFIGHRPGFELGGGFEPSKQVVDRRRIRCHGHGVGRAVGGEQLGLPVLRVVGIGVSRAGCIFPPRPHQFKIVMVTLISARDRDGQPGRVLAVPSILRSLQRWVGRVQVANTYRPLSGDTWFVFVHRRNIFDRPNHRLGTGDVRLWRRFKFV